MVRLLPQLADYAARQYGTSPFLLRPEGGAWKAMSFAQFADAMHAFAALLAEQGVQPGDRVGIQSENRPEWSVAYMGILQAGAVVVPLDVQLTAGEVGEILATSGARLCVVSARQAAVLAEVRGARLPALQIVGFDATGDQPALRDVLARHARAPRHEPRAQAHDLAVLIFTSGTTGQAKGVMLSHSNLLHNVEAVARTFEFGPADRLLSVLPLHHTFESTGGFLCPLRVGASVAYARGLKSNELREDLRSSGATILLGVPLLYEKLLGAIDRGISDAPLPRRLLARALLGASRAVRVSTGVRVGRRLMRRLREVSGLGSIRMFVCGAAPLPNQTFWGFIDLGWPVLEGYGLTECSPVVAADHPDRPRPGAIGWPIVGVDVRIEEPDTEGNGEIVVRGPNVMLGYFCNPAATAEVVREGWFYTGDLGRFDPDGRLKITGRLKNMIATAAGKKIYPEEIEAHFANCPLILEVVVTGGRDARGEREEVHAHVFPNSPALEQLAAATHRSFDDAFVEATLRAEIDARGQQLAPYKRVKRVIVRRQEFPKTTTGKIRRQNLTPDSASARSSAVA
ncbi:MAG: AMP-dependent synthetase/ligase [Candidatus Eiseniibacteriota bacterium]